MINNSLDSVGCFSNYSWRACRFLVSVFPEERYSGRIQAAAEGRAPTVRPWNSSAAAVTASLSISRVTAWLNVPTFLTSFPPIACSVNVCPVSSNAKIAGKILHIVFRIERVRNPFSRFFLDVCCKTLPAMDKTTAGISVTKPIALAALVNSDALPAIVYQTVLDATLIPIVQMLQMKWVARNPTAP